MDMMDTRDQAERDRELLLESSAKIQETCIQAVALAEAKTAPGQLELAEAERVEGEHPVQMRLSTAVAVEAVILGVATAIKALPLFEMQGRQQYELCTH